MYNEGTDILVTLTFMLELCCDVIIVRMLVTFGICFKQHFDTRYLVFYHPSPPRMFLSLDLLSEYWIQHGAIGPLYVTSSYSTILQGSFRLCNWLSLWRLVTCLLHAGPPFGNRFLNTSWAACLTYDIFFFLYFDICNKCLDTSYHFLAYLYFLNILYFSCTNIFHRRSLCTFWTMAV